MLYTDERIDLPIASTYRNPKGSKYVYLTVGSYYNAQGKQRHRQVCIGHAVTEPGGAEKLIPNLNYYKYVAKTQPPAGPVSRGRSSVAAAGSGYALAVIGLAQELGILPVLENLLGAERAHRVVAVAAYYAQSMENRSLEGFRYFMEDNFTPLLEPFDDHAVYAFTRINLLYSGIFEKFWIRRQPAVPDDLLYYELISPYTLSALLDGPVTGGNPEPSNLEQLTIGVMCSRQNRMPLFALLYEGSICDEVNYELLQRTAEWVELRLPADLEVIPAASRAQDNLSCSAARGYKVTIPCSCRRDAAVREAVLQNRQRLNAQTDNTLLIDDGGVVCAGFPFTRDETPGELMIFFDYAKCSMQISSLLRRQQQLEEELRRRQDFPEDAERFQPLFVLQKSGESGVFSYRPDAQAFADAAALCGISTCFSTKEGRDAVQCLQDLRAGKLMANLFCALKNEEQDGNIQVLNQEDLESKRIFLFIALILHQEFERRFQPLNRRYNFTTARCLHYLQRIRMVRDQEGHTAALEADSLQKELLAAVPVSTTLDHTIWP